IRPFASVLPDGNSSLSVVELDVEKVKTKGWSGRRAEVGAPGPLYSLDGTLGEPMEFTAHDFFLAIAKADLYQTFTPEDAAAHCEEFWFHCRSLLDWQKTPLHLAKGKARFYKSHGTMAGQIGEGVTLLFMRDREYPYWDHLQSLLKRAFGEAEAGKHAENNLALPSIVKPVKVARKERNKGDNSHPDFACQNEAGQWALAEAKGSFVTGKKLPNAKGDLSRAIKQLDALMKRYKFQADKTYAVGAYLREREDCCHEPSLVAFTDPANTNTQLAEAAFPSDWIRRGNYGAWLLGMGFFDSGIALRERRSREVQFVCLPVIRFADHFFAFTIQSVHGRVDAHVPPHFGSHDCSDAPALAMRHVSHHFKSEPEWVIRGIEISILRMLGSAIADGLNRSLLQLRPVRSDGGLTVGTFREEGIVGSVLADGTMLATVRPASRPDAAIQYMGFKL
ncbi:MAG: hypothetical protein WCI73_11265, partial [Phycisphaerae bacterium]